MLCAIYPQPIARDQRVWSFEEYGEDLKRLSFELAAVLEQFSAVRIELEGPEADCVPLADGHGHTSVATKYSVKAEEHL